MDNYKINIQGKEYTGSGLEVHNSIQKDWGGLTDLFVNIAIQWMNFMQREECQISFNHGNGAVGIGKYGMVPNPPTSETCPDCGGDLPGECFCEVEDYDTEEDEVFPDHEQPFTYYK